MTHADNETPLHLCTLEQIVDELGRRYGGVLVVNVDDVDATGLQERVTRALARLPSEELR